MKTKKKLVCFITLLTLTLILMVFTGCQNGETDTTDKPTNPFTTTWSLGNEGKIISISGDSTGHVPGSSVQFILRQNNTSGTDEWQGEYCILLVDNHGIVKEITHSYFSVPAGLDTQTTIPVDFPADLDGPYGLCLLIPGRGVSITTIWIGDKLNVDAGPWPNIKSCPQGMTEQYGLIIAQEFVKNSPTFLFDGIENTLEMVASRVINGGWEFTFTFESLHAGYGDRTDEMLAQVITPHEAVIKVVDSDIESAEMDMIWDMLNQRMLD